MKKPVVDIIVTGPCKAYSLSKIKSLVGKGITEEEVTHLDIPESDKIWARIFCLTMVKGNKGEKDGKSFKVEFNIRGFGRG